MNAHKNLVGLLMLLELLLAVVYGVGVANVTSMGHEQARAKACSSQQRVLQGALDMAELDGMPVHPAGRFSAVYEGRLIASGQLRTSVRNSLPKEDCRLFLASESVAFRPYCLFHGTADGTEEPPEAFSAYVPPDKRPWTPFRSGDASGILLALPLMIIIGMLYRTVADRQPATLTLRFGLYVLFFLGDGRAISLFVGLAFLGLTFLAVAGLFGRALALMWGGEPSQGGEIAD